MKEMAGKGNMKKMDMSESMQSRMDKVRSALPDNAWMVECFTDRVVYEQDNKLYQASYSVDDSGKATLGEAKEVQRKVDYMPMQAASKLLAASGNPGDDDYGYKWRVQVIEYGPGKDGRINWPREPLVAAISLYDGAKVFALNESQHQAGAKAFGKSVREIVGWLKDPVDTGTGIEADFFILKSAQWLRDGLVDSHERGNPTLFGLSHDVTATTVTRMVAGKKMKEPVTIRNVEVDVVYDPTNNGKFIRMAAAVGQETEDEMILKLLAALQRTRPDLHKEIKDGMDNGTLTEEQALDRIAAATVQDVGGDTANEKLVAAVVAGLKQTLSASDGEELKQMKLVACKITLDAGLTASKLPDALQDKLRTQFKDRVFEEADLTAAIKLEKETYDKLVGSGSVQGLGDTRVIRDTGEKLQAAVDGLFGVQANESCRDIKPFTSLRAAYVEMTGDTEIRGYLDPQQIRRLQAAGFDTTTFAYAIGNTLYRRITKDYQELGDLGVSRLISYERNAPNFKPLYAIKIGYFGDLPTVTPQTDDYPDLGTLSDEQIEFAIAQKGGIITITRAMILNDDVDLVRKIVNRLPRAARRTFAKKIFSPLIDNAVYQGDGVALFHADHGNLGSAAYAIASALAGKVAMAKQTEYGSGERFGTNRPVTVIFPSDLYGTVKNVNTYNPQAATIDNANPMYGFFQEAGLIECPFMTDASDWIFASDPNEMEMCEVAYLNNQREPEMFVADNPAYGQFFVADKIQYKIRHEYQAEYVEFRGLYKGVVA